MAEPHVLGKTAYLPSSENPLHLAFSALFVLEAGRFGLREVRVPGHERADPESWVELYKWGQDSGTGHVSPPTRIPLLLWWGPWGFGISLLCPVVFFRLACGTVFCISLSLPKTKNWFGGSFHVLLFYLSS